MNIKEIRYDDAKMPGLEIIEGYPSIFLAGPTVRGNQPHLTSWRFEAIEEFKKQEFKGTLIIPEFINKTESDEFRYDLPAWEYDGLEKADCIMFWVPRTRELIGLTTNCEFGYWLSISRHKIIYGHPDDAYRIKYLDLLWELDLKHCAPNSCYRYTSAVSTSLSDTIYRAITLTKTWYPALT